jgi:hypothetical protein
MSFTYRAPRFIKGTSIVFDEAVLSTDHCGLFRAPLHLAASLMPSMADLIASAPIDVSQREEWEVDIKVHMLMKDQYPCIPNWHCDNVPRADNATRYDLIGEHGGAFDWATNRTYPMYLWVSDEPTTEFLAHDFTVPEAPKNHADVASDVNDWAMPVERILKNAWYAMDQRTPHRGRPAERNGWRVFARLTHKSIAPARPVVSVIRRHAQVYLEANHFTW